MATLELEPRASATSAGGRWSRRPWLSWFVRVGSLVVPVAGSVATAWALTASTPTPDTWQLAVVRWLLIAAASSLVLMAVERYTRRLLPIATLFDLTLAFPDQAPSRFRVAMRTGTMNQLERRIEEVRSGAAADPSVGAAQRVIELVAALSVHDRITRGHSERVRAYTQMIADEMRLPEHERDRLRWAGLLHDVGKLLVPTSILNKKGRLTDEEFAIVKTHPENGRRIIEELIPWLGESSRAVWEHHEKWDGTGYPRGLVGTDISLAARIVAVADVYDVMTSSRSYKEAVSPKDARAELARCAGTHFDPDVVRAFLNISLGRVRRTAGPLSWVSQIALFPTAVIGSSQAAGGVVVLTGALSASSVGLGAQLRDADWSLPDPREIAAWVGQERSIATATDDAWPSIEAVSAGGPVTIVTVPPRSALAAAAEAGDEGAPSVVTVSTSTLPVAADDSTGTSRDPSPAVVVTPPPAPAGPAPAAPVTPTAIGSTSPAPTTVAPAATGPTPTPTTIAPTTTLPNVTATTTLPVVTVPTTTLPVPTTTLPTSTTTLPIPPTTTVPPPSGPVPTVPVTPGGGASGGRPGGPAFPGGGGPGGAPAPGGPGGPTP